MENFLKTYNIGMYGGTKSGTANNTANTPVTFGRLFNDATGKAPFPFEEYSEEFRNRLVKADTTVTVGTESATVSTNSSGQLVVNGVVYENYYLGASNGLWYRNEYAAEMKDGVYGYASYNHNGKLSDGYVYGLDNALEILEDYYYSQKRMTEISNTAALQRYSAHMPSDDQIIEKATELRAEYYSENGEATAYEKFVWNQKLDLSGLDIQDDDFSLSKGELQDVLDALGVALGGALGPAVKKLFVGIPGLLKQFNIKLDGVQLNPIGDYGLEVVIEGDDATTTDDDIFITVTVEEWYIDAERNSGGEDALNITLSGIANGEYHLGLDSRLISGLSELLDGLVANADPKLVRVEATKETPAVYYETVAEIVYDVLNGGGAGTIGTIGTVLDLVGGLISIVGDITDLITIETNDKGEVITSTEDMLYGLITNLLSALYWYSDPVIKPVYEFYAEAAESLVPDNAEPTWSAVELTQIDPEDIATTEEIKAAAREYGEQLASYQRAVYEGGMHGYMIGSVIVPGASLIAGDTLGNGSYSATVPASYEEVMLFKAELSYKRWLYPLLGVRECLVCFMPFVLLFILLSGVAAEKEMLYATGQEVAKKSKKDKKEEEAAGAEDTNVSAADAAGAQVTDSAVSEEGTEPLAAANNDEEVL